MAAMFNYFRCTLLPRCTTCPSMPGMAHESRYGSLRCLRAITINAAEHIGVADRVGSLETGKTPTLWSAKALLWKFQEWWSMCLLMGNWWNNIIYQKLLYTVLSLPYTACFYFLLILFLKILLASPKITSFKVQIFIISLFKDLLFIGNFSRWYAS